MNHEQTPQTQTDRERQQGGYATEARRGGLYPAAGTFLAGLVIGGLAVIAVI